MPGHCRIGWFGEGLARDWRTLSQMQEVIQADNCKTLMCFICDSKHVYYRGFDKYGKEYNAGRIDYRNTAADRAHLSNLFSAADFEFCVFTKKFMCQTFQKMLRGCSGIRPDALHRRLL